MAEKREPKKPREGQYALLESPFEDALREFAERVAADKRAAVEAARTEVMRSERPTLRGIPVAKIRALEEEMRSSSDTLTGFPPAQPPTPSESASAGRRRGGYVAPEALSEAEQALLKRRLKGNPAFVESMLQPLNASIARMLLEKIREESRHVDALEKKGFPKGVPQLIPFLAALGPIPREEPGFQARMNNLKALRSLPSEELKRVRGVGLAVILAERFGEFNTGKLERLKPGEKEAVFDAIVEHENLRSELHEKGFPKELPVPHGLSESMDVAPTHLSEHFPELDRHLQTLRKLNNEPPKQIVACARYVKRVAKSE